MPPSPHHLAEAKHSSLPSGSVTLKWALLDGAETRASSRPYSSVTGSAPSCLSEEKIKVRIVSFIGFLLEPA